DKHAAGTRGALVIRSGEVDPVDSAVSFSIAFGANLRHTGADSLAVGSGVAVTSSIDRLVLCDRNDRDCHRIAVGIRKPGRGQNIDRDHLLIRRPKRNGGGPAIWRIVYYAPGDQRLSCAVGDAAVRSVRCGDRKRDTGAVGGSRWYGYINSHIARSPPRQSHHRWLNIADEAAIVRGQDLERTIGSKIVGGVLQSGCRAGRKVGDRVVDLHLD